MPQHTKIAGLADYLDHGYTLRAFCYNRRCMHNAVIDLATLTARIGRETALRDIRERFRCSVCGGCDCGITISPPTVGPGAYPIAMPV